MRGCCPDADGVCSASWRRRSPPFALRNASVLYALRLTVALGGFDYRIEGSIVIVARKE
jgi:hypothetical protein